MEWFGMDPIIMRYLGQAAPWADVDQVLAASLPALIFRPVQPDDADLIVEMHQRLSAATIYNRYHSPRVPTRQEIAQICQLDGSNGRALVAAVGGKKAAVVALAYYMHIDPQTAEMALLVEDGYQRQGIGKRLMQQLRDIAVAQGVYFFEAFVLPTNKAMLHLLQQNGQVVQNKLGYGAREIRLQLTAVPTWEVLVPPRLKPADCLPVW